MCASARFLYPRPKKPTHIVNCHVEGVKREENIGSSYTYSLLLTFKKATAFHVNTYIRTHVQIYRTYCTIRREIWDQKAYWYVSPDEVAEANNIYLSNTY